MSLNPLMTLLARGVAELVEPQATVVELGNQTFNADDKTLKRVIARPQGRAEIDRDGLNALLAMSREERRDKTARYYRCLGFSDYVAIDVNEDYDSLVMDLNRDLKEDYGYERTFSLATNNGTGEHIFDQATVLRNLHALTKPGGVMVHVMPFVNYINHGFYSYHPNLYNALAGANGYRIVAMGLGNRRGYGSVAVPRPEVEAFEAYLHDETAVDLATLMAKPKLPGRPLTSKLKYWGLRLVEASRPAVRFGTAIDRLQHIQANVVVFAILRKINDAPFRFPIQGIYEDAISDAELRSDYERTETIAASQ